NFPIFFFFSSTPTPRTPPLPPPSSLPQPAPDLSGVGRETHKMMLDHYQQTKNLLVSYDINPLGFF
ncbi:hypothetical protein, partial [Pseudomonas aeruginosa]|uniref:hypothetical protein n=1 Tax=Pseudomonas aeruginosa TaxID=287 RepID=UPI003981FA47